MKTHGPTMQCNSKTSDYVKCSNCPLLAITHSVILSAQITTEQSLDQWSSVCQVSIKRCLN